MGMSLGPSLRLTQRCEQKQVLVSRLPDIQWSLLKAYQSGFAGGPPPFIPPNFEEEVFEPRVKLVAKKIDNFDVLDHPARMLLVDQANRVFRYAYTRGEDVDTGKEKGYYRVPLLRDRNITEDPDGIDDISEPITKKEYRRAKAILDAVGEMERIARAVPYYDLYTSVLTHIRNGFSVELNQIVLVSIDRGGRLPCLILQRALNLTSMETLKVDQGGGILDEDKLNQFVQSQTLKDRHVLFVDSTVDSGRQIRVLEKYFDNANWKSKIGHISWSIVGSNEYAENLNHHYNLNWGVDPDSTFEDDPELMGIDYAGSHIKVVEKPSAASEAIRKCLLSVPAGVIYDADNIDEQIDAQYAEWEKRQAKRRKKHNKDVATAKAAHDKEVKTYEKEKSQAQIMYKVESKWAQITTTRKWQNAVAQAPAVSFESLPAAVPNGVHHNLHNILVIGNGKRADIPENAATLIADSIGSHHSFFAGTPNGNPGVILRTVLQRVNQPEVRLYQPGYMQGEADEIFGGVPVVFAGPGKDEMRVQMVSDSHIALALGGGEGTLREVLLAHELGKPVVMVKGWGPIPTYVLWNKRLSSSPNIKVCDGIVEAVQTVMEMTKA